MKTLKHILALAILASCHRDGEKIEEVLSNNILESSYTIDRFKVLEISTKIDNASFVWKIDGKEYSTKPTLEFISTENQNYTLTLEVNSNGEKKSYTSTIIVNKEANEYSKFISKVLEYCPAVGQFINVIPAYKSGNTEREMISKASKAIVGDTNDIISLGGYGGYVVFGFDHTIPNFKGNDFRIFGNAFSGSHESGIVMVAYDRNKNGQPDADEWHELAGSEYFKAETIKNYSIVYHQPDESSTNTKYIKWEDNQGDSGYKIKNSYHKQSYYPLWISEKTLSFVGSKLANNYTQTNGFWKGTAPEFGYADVNQQGDEMDISWAVDNNGNAVELIGIDFVKVYTATNQEAGWLGEISTEIKKAENLWLK